MNEDGKFAIIWALEFQCGQLWSSGRNDCDSWKCFTDNMFYIFIVTWLYIEVHNWGLNNWHNITFIKYIGHKILIWIGP